MWILLAACAQAPEPPSVPIEDAVASVSDHLRTTAELSDRRQALVALAVARSEFEETVEPQLRRTRDPLDVAAAEYGFARVYRAIEDGGDTRSEVEILLRRLRPPRLANR